MNLSKTVNSYVRSAKRRIDRVLSKRRLSVRINRRGFKRGAAVAFVLIIAIVGTYIQFSSKAAAPVSSLEAEGGTVAGCATTTTDPNASGSRAIKFGNATCSGGPIYYVSLSGSDSNPGSITQPWRTVKYALGHLTAGSTLYIRGGTYYNEAGTTVSLVGTSSAPITVASYPGERAIIDGAAPDFYTTGQNKWELVDSSIGLWRTVGANFSGNDLAGGSGSLAAWLASTNTQLVHYGGVAGEVPDSINTTNYTVNGFNPLYVGPGVQLRGDGHVYIRLAMNPGDTTDQSGNPIANMPVDANPNNVSLAISQADYLLNFNNAQYLNFNNISFEHGNYGFEFNGSASNITFNGDDMTYGSYGMVVYSGSGMRVQNCTFSEGIPDWLYWSDIKEASYETSPAYPQMQSVAIDGTLTNWQITGNTFQSGLDSIHLKPSSINASVTNNYFLNNRDDAIELWQGISNIEIANNMMRHVHNGLGITRATGGTAGPIYVHNNVIDVSKYQHQGRTGNYLGAQYGVWAGASPFEAHSGTAGTDDSHQLKFYNNTVVARPGRGSNAMGPRNVTGTSNLYVYNNVWYAIGAVPIFSTTLESSGAHYDGDVVWQPNAGGAYLFQSFGTGGNFTTLAGYTGTTGTTWEKNGLQVDPGFNLGAIDGPDPSPLSGLWSIYKPTNSQVLTPGASYSGLGWPGTGGLTYRGAVPTQ